MKCLYCGEEIKRSCHKKAEDRKYCSKECYQKANGLEKRPFYYTICQYCGKTFKETRDRPNLYCSKQCAGKARGQINLLANEKIKREKKALFDEYTELIKKAEHIRYRLEHEKYCKVCGELFIAVRPAQECCSPECSRKNDNRRRDKRLNRNGKPDASISLARLYQRDHGICQICGESLSFDCDYNSDEYPSIDHIKPIAKGGTHTWDNVQLACRGCNTIKGARW